MKKIIKIFASIGIALCLILFVGCKNTNNYEASQNVKDSGTKNYYEKKGYVPLTLSDELSVTLANPSVGEIINFNDSSTYVKPNTIISVSVNNKYFVNNNYPATDLKHSKILSGLKINGKVFLIEELDYKNLVIYEKTTIYPVFSSFDIIGLAISLNDEKVPTDKSIFSNDNLFYIRTTNFSKLENLTDNNKTYNINHRLKISNYDVPEFNITFELIVSNLKIKTHLLLKISDDRFLLYNISNNSFACDSFRLNISFTNDITTSENLKK